jgi:large subunit ribosomal protein L30
MSDSPSGAPRNAKQEPQGSLIVVNLRGTVNLRAPVRRTLEQLHVARRFNSTIVPDTREYRGMLYAAKDHVAWCKADASVVEKILNSRAEKTTGNRPPRWSSSTAAETGNSFTELSEQIALGKVRLDGSQGFKAFFRLHPPRGGFNRSTRRPYNQGGVLGSNVDLPELIQKML